ncbi:hypothetical protein [Nostoc sp.]|uniref:hypothetical protein n=1 Tax=Nostoc sp. TaxID=1180 RepID=UPI002FFC83A6
MGVEDFNTPPSTPGSEENASRRFATDDEIERSLILNLANPTNQDIEEYGGNYKKYKVYSNESIHEVGKDDRHHARFSTLLFNEAAKRMENQEMKAEALNEEEGGRKEEYLRKVRKDRNMEGEGGAYMHEPDQQFVPGGNPARRKGGSLMGTHHGTLAANGMMGQVLDNRHPQNDKARGGVKSWLVHEVDGKTYKYEVRSEIVDSLKKEGWSDNEIKSFYLDVSAVSQRSGSEEEARQILVENYIRHVEGRLRETYEKAIDNAKKDYLSQKITCSEFKGRMAGIVNTDDGKGKKSGGEDYLDWEARFD